MSDSENRPDQRRQIRFAVSQAARLTIGEHRDIPCEIQDFCLGGVYLRLETPEDARYTMGREGEEIKLAFTPPTSLSPKTFELTATLVRRTANGVGAAFR